MSGGAPLSPNPVLKNQRHNPTRVTNWTGPPDHKKLCGQRNNSGEREVPALQNKRAIRAELHPLKAKTDNPGPSAGEDTMQCGRDVAWSNPHTAMPKTEASTSLPGEGWGRESEAPWTYASSPYREVQLPEVPPASHHAQNTSAWNALVKRITARQPKQTDPLGEGERQQGQKKKKGQDPLLRWREGDTQSPHQKWRQLNVALPPTSEQTGRPKDDTNSPRGQAGKTLPRAKL